MDPAELERLAAEIAGSIIAAEAPPPAGTCPKCLERCLESCAPKARAIISAGAARLSSDECLARVLPELAPLIDHTILKPEATAEEVRLVCREARQYGFASVCVNPHRVPLVAAALQGSPVKVCTVIGFPLGATSTPAKVFEAETAIRDGALELDMVMNIGALKGGDLDVVRTDIHAVAAACHRGGAILKVIIETALLSDIEKTIACAIAKMAGSDFVKTSTGFSKSGATAADIALMRLVVGPEMGVKASGGIRSLADLQSMTAAGASRIGASASVKIVREACP